MHIPDGFLSPETYITLYAVNTPLWVYSFKKLKIQKKEIPLIATLSGFAYLLTSIQFPIPGGTSVHLIGLVILTKLFGFWKTYFIYSSIFLLQSLLLGLGGITGFPLLCLSLGFIGSFSVNFLDKILKFSSNIKIVILNIVGILLSVSFVSFVLGLQPLIANQNGKPLFFPYNWNIVFPTMIISHLPVIIIESIVSILFFKFYEKHYKTE